MAARLELPAIMTKCSSEPTFAGIPPASGESPLPAPVHDCVRAEDRRLLLLPLPLALALGRRRRRRGIPKTMERDNHPRAAVVVVAIKWIENDLDSTEL